jgi:hypothetical protein
MATSTKIPGPAPKVDPDGAQEPERLRAVRTTNFPANSRQLGASLFVTTHQAGKLVVGKQSAVWNQCLFGSGNADTAACAAR